MNTINTIRPYVSLKNTSQPTNTSTPTAQAPAFKGALGDTVVKKIANKEALKATGIVAMAAGLIGLSKDKVNDIVESLVNRIYGLQNKNEELNLEIKKTKERATQKEAEMLSEFAQKESNMRNWYDEALKKKDDAINVRDKQIAELQKYQAMGNVKSVDEIGIVTPKQFLEVLNEAKEAELEADKSLLTYLFTGKGQENFLAQLERNNTLYKARRDGIYNIPEIKEAAEKSGLRNIGTHPINYIINSTQEVLIRFEEGAQIAYPPIMQQIYENANALIVTVKKQPNEGNDLARVLRQTKDFFKNLAYNRSRLEQQGYRFEGRGEHNNLPYYSFKNDDLKRDYYLRDLANGRFDSYRETKADGKVEWTTKYWE